MDNLHHRCNHLLDAIVYVFKNIYVLTNSQIMFRAGRLSKLEEIREGALTKIVLKMQCTARVVLMKLSKYNDLKAQKNLLSSIQRNIRSANSYVNEIDKKYDCMDEQMNE